MKLSKIPQTLGAGLLLLCAVGAGTLDPDTYLLFRGHSEFRAVMNASGVVIPDVELWDVGPGPGEVRYWEQFKIKLVESPADVLQRKQEGGHYRDQFGGSWTVRLIKVGFANKLAPCAVEPRRPSYEGQCYFLVPEFGGYQTDRISYKPGVQPVKTEFLKSYEFPRHRIEGRPGNWKAIFTTDSEKSPAQELAVVPGSALEKAGFGLSAEYGTIIDVDGKGIEYVDTLGIDGYVIHEALRSAYQSEAKKMLAQESLRQASERMGQALKQTP